jgi:carboxyl-terminal processing protease
MKRLKNKRILFLGIPVFITILTLCAFRSVDFKTSKSLEIFFSFFREVNIFYVDKTDPEQLIQIGIDAMLESLDPYNEFITEDNIETLEFQTTGEYGGMGALIRHGLDYPVIAEVYEGSPAHKAGIMAGDIILWIDSINVKGMPVDLVSKLLKGAPKTNLSIFIKRHNHIDSLQFVFKREKIHIPSVPFYGLVSDNIGYIRLANFTTDCNKEVERALKNLKSKDKAKGLILDLRGNPGGLLFEAVKIVNLFVQKNELVVYTKGQIKEFDQQYKTPSRPVDTDIPLVVLVDRASASASEIVAGALQDLDRAVILGERTFGKGLVQATRSLPYNTQLKITTAKYYIPSGRCIQAVDYSQRDENGSLGFIPDSLVSEFKTRNGRSVYDGGGITPDIQHQLSLYSRISSVLYARNILFDYATLYRHSNKQIHSPDSFYLTDKEFESFVDYLNQIGFEYQSQTEYQLNELVKASKQEEFMPLIQDLVDSLQSIITKNRKKEIYAYSFEIKKLLEEEIVSRYYLQNGRSKYIINNDKAIPISLEILNDSDRYLTILSKASKDSDPFETLNHVAQ